MISEILKSSSQPALYEAGNAFMWTDPHIAKQLLEVHLNPEIDLASRKPESIHATINWILDEHAPDRKLKILDLGCGPGLYSEILANAGHSVTGMDISLNSIEYAKQSSIEQGLDIDYRHGSYLDLDLGTEEYDLVLLIYTDFGPLLPKERLLLIEKVAKSLNDGGKFIFDVLRKNEIASKVSPINWGCASSGFWSNEAHLTLSSSFHYPEADVILYQHIICEESGGVKTYRFWNHFYDENSIQDILSTSSFGDVEFEDDIVLGDDPFSGKNVLFTIATKASSKGL
ncbi:MAG: class I SAM-dependent methyltransferase [Flavobacteriia bacterium]|nr:class I SAM-dependent methyltransferase [Flavobacteriia bacterium]